MYDVLPLHQLMPRKGNYFAGRTGTGTMQVRKICLTAAMVAIVVSIAVVISFLVCISLPRDEIESFDYPPEFFCASSENRIDYQTNGKCAAYAAAYLLRDFGEDTDGEVLFPELKRTLGFVSANSIVDVFEWHGYQAKACHGSVDTLKQRLTEGNPIIVFIRIPGDTHYAVVVGYDEQHIYLVDSLAENANTSDARYNRVLTTENFEAVWKTGTLLPDNIYITFSRKERKKMHIDQMLAEWTAPLWAQLGMNGITALLVLTAVYFTVKLAVKNGVKEAFREMKESEEAK